MTCQVACELYRGKCARGHDTRVALCGTCGYVHVFPKPTEEEMAEYYKTAYYTQDKPQYSKDQDRIGEYLDVVNQEKILALGPAGAAIDVGCGRETRWMRALAGVGWRVAGADPSLDLVEEVAGFDIYPETWRARAGLLVYTADLITANFVLEHLADPIAVLCEWREILHEEGRLLVEVPWDFNPIQMQVWKPLDQAWWVSTPDHVNYFNPGSLEALLRRCGFTPEVTRSTYPIEQLLVQGHDYRVDPEAKKLAVSERAERQRVHWALGHSALCQEGRTVWCVARKA